MSGDIETDSKAASNFENTQKVGEDEFVTSFIVKFREKSSKLDDDWIESFEKHLQKGNSRNGYVETYTSMKSIWREREHLEFINLGRCRVLSNL